jgi:hypothetical protein
MRRSAGENLFARSSTIPRPTRSTALSFRGVCHSDRSVAGGRLPAVPADRRESQSEEVTPLGWDGAGAGRGLPKARARRGERRTRAAQRPALLVSTA